MFLVLGVLGWILSTLDASLAELQPEQGGHSARNINGLKMARNGLKHRKLQTDTLHTAMLPNSSQNIITKHTVNSSCWGQKPLLIDLLIQQ